MTNKEWSPANVLDVFGDPVARATLVLASDRLVTVGDVAERLDVSEPTIYRRIEPLVEANLLRERCRIDAGGNQPSEYETILDRVTFHVDAGGYTVDIEVRQDLADDVESMWADLERTASQGDGPPRTHSSGSIEWHTDPS